MWHNIRVDRTAAVLVLAIVHHRIMPWCRAIHVPLLFDRPVNHLQCLRSRRDCQVTVQRPTLLVWTLLLVNPRDNPL